MITVLLDSAAPRWWLWVLSSFSGQHPEARGHLSEALTEDTGVGNSVAGSPLPLTTGNENLDVAIVIHLQYCNHLIQVTAWHPDNRLIDTVDITSVFHVEFCSFPPVTAVVDQLWWYVAASQHSPQTVQTDGAVGGSSRDQCGQTGSHYICCWW